MSSPSMVPPSLLEKPFWSPVNENVRGCLVNCYVQFKSYCSRHLGNEGRCKVYRAPIFGAPQITAVNFHVKTLAVGRRLKDDFRSSPPISGCSSDSSSDRRAIIADMAARNRKTDQLFPAADPAHL